MTIKQTNAQWFESLIVLGRANETGVLGFAIAQNRRKVADELKEYLAKRDEILKQYGTEDGDGKFKIVGKNTIKYLEAIKPFDDMETEISVRQVTAEQFCLGNLNSNQMFKLEWMVAD